MKQDHADLHDARSPLHSDHPLYKERRWHPNEDKAEMMAVMDKESIACHAGSEGDRFIGMTVEQVAADAYPPNSSMGQFKASRARAIAENAMAEPKPTHVLRSWTYLFQAMADGAKKHDLRNNDRGYKVGDILRLEEFNMALGNYTGRAASFRVTYITGRSAVPCAVSSSVLAPDHVILSVECIWRSWP